MHLRDSTRTILQRLGLVIGVAGIVLGTGIAASGGFEPAVPGAPVLPDWVWPFIASVPGWVIFTATGGRVVLPPSLSASGGRRICDLMAALLGVITLAVSIMYSTTAAGGADSYGYVSQAELWLSGQGAIDQPWVKAVPWPLANATFTPLAYSTSPDPEQPWTIVPTYPPGLPWLMALGKIIGGQEGMYWVAPILGALTVLATYGIGLRLVSPVGGLIAAWLMATSPLQLYMQVQPMSDGPAAGAWALALFFVLGWTPGAALAAGAATALAITIRPNLVFGAGILGLWYLIRLWRARPDERGARLREAVCYGVAAACGIAAVALVNNSLNGSPFRSGYGTLEGFFSRDHIWPNMRDYFVWLVERQTPVILLAFVGLTLPIRAFWPAARDRAVIPILAAFVLGVWAFYCYYLHFDVWWYLRFHLPVFPLLMTGVAAVVMAVIPRVPPIARVLVVVLVAALGAHTLRTVHDVGTYELWKADRHYPAVARLVRRTTERKSVVISMQHSGSLRYYGGRLTMRYDLLGPQWLDRAVAWLESRGIRTYLLIDKWEEPHVVERFRGQAALEHLKSPPAAVYRGPTIVNLFDLTRRPDGIYPPTVEFIDDWSNSRSFPPVDLVLPFE